MGNKVACLNIIIFQNYYKIFSFKRAEFDLLRTKLFKSQILTSSSTQSDSFYENSQLIHSASSSNLNKFHQFPSYPTFNRQNSQQNLANQRSMYMNLRSYTNVHMTCNKCGKNLLEKTPLTIDTNPSNQLIRQNSQYYNSNASLNLGISSSSLISNQKSILFRPNDQTLNGCLYCARFLPQCTVCLKLMKINLQPNLTPTNPTTHILNRSQSLYANIPMPIYSTNNSTDKLALQSKSPTTIQISQSQTLSTNMPHSADMNFHFFSDLNDQTDEIKPQYMQFENRFKSSINPENIYFLNNNKFGNWFSWCQTCKHGGHINCLINWFRDHAKCPFLHCKCQCLNLDNNIN